MRCSKVHMELDENGEGKCSVPMWRLGMPAGFCEDIAFGKPTKEGKLRYRRYVPYLACYGHGGPKSKHPKYHAHQGDPCKYCGTPHDDVEVGPCPSRIEEKEA